MVICYGHIICVINLSLEYFMPRVSSQCVRFLHNKADQIAVLACDPVYLSKIRVWRYGETNILWSLIYCGGVDNTQQLFASLNFGGRQLLLNDPFQLALSVSSTYPGHLKKSYWYRRVFDVLVDDDQVFITPAVVSVFLSSKDY